MIKTNAVLKKKSFKMILFFSLGGLLGYTFNPDKTLGETGFEDNSEFGFDN